MRHFKLLVLLLAPLGVFIFYQNMVSFKGTDSGLDPTISQKLLKHVQDNLPKEVLDQMDQEKLKKAIDSISYEALVPGESNKAEEICEGCASGADGRKYNLSGTPMGMTSSSYRRQPSVDSTSENIDVRVKGVVEERQIARKDVPKPRKREKVEPVQITNPYDPKQLNQLIDAAKQARENMDLHYKQLEQIGNQ